MAQRFTCFGGCRRWRGVPEPGRLKIYMSPERKDICDCGNLERMADEPNCPVEFDYRTGGHQLLGKGREEECRLETKREKTECHYSGCGPCRLRLHDCLATGASARARLSGQTAEQTFGLRTRFFHDLAAEL